jgi:hypothetical protein
MFMSNGQTQEQPKLTAIQNSKILYIHNWNYIGLKQISSAFKTILSFWFNKVDIARKYLLSHLYSAQRGGKKLLIFSTDRKENTEEIHASADKERRLKTHRIDEHSRSTHSWDTRSLGRWLGTGKNRKVLLELW